MDAQATAQPAAGHKPVDLNKITAVIIKIREKRSALKKEYETADAELISQTETLEAFLLKTLDTMGVKRMATDNASFYKEKTMKPHCTDWSALYAHIKETGDFDALEKRVTKSYVEAYIKEHETPPPGVSTHEEWVVRVRRNKEN